MYNVVVVGGGIVGLASALKILETNPRWRVAIIETIHAYGASNKPDSPHFNDQMEMFTQQKRKSMTLDIEEVRKNAVRIYSPK